MRGEGLVIPGDSGQEICVPGTKGEDQCSEWSPGYLSHLLGPHSVLNQPLHICSHGEARSLENLRVGRHNSRGASPVSAAGAPGTEGSERARRAPEDRSPGARAARAPRRAGAERGGGLGPTAAGVVEGPRFVIVFVSERSEFVTPVPLPPPPARWEEEGECSSSSSRRQPHRGGGGRASTLLAERARAPERRCSRRS